MKFAGNALWRSPCEPTSRAGAPRWEEMKGRARCKEADILAVQNYKWIGGHGGTSKDQCSNLYVGHEKVTSAPFFPSGDIRLLYTFAVELYCAAYSAVQRSRNRRYRMSSR